MFDKFVEHWHASGVPLEVYLGMLPDGDPFKTILVEWRTDSSRIEVDRKILKYVSTAFGDLLADKNMTRAEACRVTRLNKGNFYAFLKGDTSKMSRKTAMNAYREIAALWRTQSGRTTRGCTSREVAAPTFIAADSGPCESRCAFSPTAPLRRWRERRGSRRARRLPKRPQPLCSGR